MLKKYVGVKLVEAEPMNRKEFTEDRCLADFGPNEDGYKVLYPDGYVSWCPKKQFEEANRPVDGLTFGHAIEMAKKGCKIARNGWNGKNMYLTIIEPGNAMYHGFDMQRCIGMKTADGKMQPGWLASQADMLADDWRIID